MERSYFPLGLATDRSFCNRVQERKQLRMNISAARHTLIISPRRYGKTSLVLYTLKNMRIPHVHIDLFMTIDAQSIQTEILNGIKILINKILPKYEQAIIALGKWIKKLQLKLKVGTDGVGIELLPVEKNNATVTIKSALMLLEKILASKDKQAVLFIDECQEIGQVAADQGIEGAIRHVAQMTEHLQLIFSGSNRRLLAKMFNDSARPLYKLCERMTIDRIHEKDYTTFIQKVAKEQWNIALPQDIIEIIYALTERHPYYMNLLCGRTFLEFSDHVPVATSDVVAIWRQLCEEEKPVAARELGELSELQRRILWNVANGHNYELSSQESLRRLKASSGAVSKALGVLLVKDYLLQDESSHYRLLDPFIRTLLESR